MSWYELLLFVHILLAAALVVSVGVSAPLVFGGAGDEQRAASLGRVTAATGAIGGVGVMVLGVLLVVDQKYEFFSGWILGTFALWILGSVGGPKIAGPDGRTWWWATVAALVGIAVLMITKPGA